MWSPQTEALFDIRIIDTDALRCIIDTDALRCIIDTDALRCIISTVLQKQSLKVQQKKRMYQKAVEDRRGQFTPFVVSERQTILNSWFCQNQAIICNLGLCLWGSRVKWRCGLGFDDGATLPAH